MSTPYVSPYLMQSSQASRSNDYAQMTPDEVMGDETLSIAEKSLYLDRMEQEGIAAITAEEGKRPTRLLEAIKSARRELTQSS